MRNYMTTYDPFFDQILFGNRSSDSKLMRTNIKETKENYELTIDLPGVNKEDVNVSLKEGNLTVTCKKIENKKEDSVFLLKERFEGTYSRSYYVGDDIKIQDITAKMENGVLSLMINKRKPEEKPTEQFVPII